MSTLDLLTAHRISRIHLPTRAGSPLKLECVVRLTSAPYFEAIFLPNELPAGELDLNGICQVYFEANGASHGVEAKIEAVSDTDRLRLFALETVTPRQKREYFRVDSKVYLDFRLLKPAGDGPVESFCGIVNLSGGGVFFPVKTAVAVHTEMLLDLFLGESFGEARGIVGEVVRIHESRRGERWVGVKFVRIAPQDLDRIIAFCLAQQRQTLRLRVMTVSPA